MLLVDTSVWIRFLAGREPFAGRLDALLEREEVLGHEMVFGELLIGERRDRSMLLASYDVLPRAPTVPHREVVEFVRGRRLQGRGIGWIDAHLLASAVVARTRMWTADASLDAVAADLGIRHTSA